MRRCREWGVSPGDRAGDLNGDTPASPPPMRILTREELARHPSWLLSSGRNRTKADVRAFEIDGERIIVKDFRGRGSLVRGTIGRFSIARECRAYGRLGSVAGIPRFYGRIDAHALACAFVP